jgi:hypothetical protein
LTLNSGGFILPNREEMTNQELENYDKKPFTSQVSSAENDILMQSFGH